MSRLVCLNDLLLDTGNTDSFYIRGTLQADAVSTPSFSAAEVSAGDGTNGVVLSSTGVLLNGTATQWDDLRIPGSSIPAGATAPDIISFLGSGGLTIYGFAGASTTEQLFFSIQLPHGYKVGSNIYPHVHWVPTDTGAGNVEWSLEYSWASINATFPASQTIRATAVDAGGTAWVHKLSSFPAISGSGKGISSMMQCRIFRDYTRDTYGSDAGLLEIDFHDEIDSFGSREEYIK